MRAVALLGKSPDRGAGQQWHRIIRSGCRGAHV